MITTILDAAEIHQKGKKFFIKEFDHDAQAPKGKGKSSPSKRSRSTRSKRQVPF
jgi:hypothetical protein